MGTADLHYIFFGDEVDSDAEGIDDPYGEWIRQSLYFKVSEPFLMNQLEQIERWLHCENTSYYRILEFSNDLVDYPMFLEYVRRRDNQGRGQDFSDADADALVDKIYALDKRSQNQL